jgi:hypothetical protein
MAAHGGQGLRRLVGHSGAAVETLLPCFLHGARRVVGQRAWLARCGSLGFLARHVVKREAAHVKKKNPPFCFLPLLHVHGRKKEEQCRSKRHRSDLLLLLFFFFFGMKRRRFRQNAPFHLSPARRQNASICKAALNYLLSFNCIPANFGLRPYSWPRFSLWSLASDLCN